MRSERLFRNIRGIRFRPAGHILFRRSCPAGRWPAPEPFNTHRRSRRGYGFGISSFGCDSQVTNLRSVWSYMTYSYRPFGASLLIVASTVPRC